MYVDTPLEVGSEIALPQAAVHHARTVLRVTRDDDLTLFNGDGSEYACRVVTASKRELRVQIEQSALSETESPLQITLVQAVSRGERMDYTIQKAIELGVSSIEPVISERTVVKLDASRAERKWQHWQGIVRHAAAQSGRSVIPRLGPICGLSEWLANADTRDTYVLQPRAEKPLTALEEPVDELTIIAGPEGGFASHEIDTLLESGVLAARLGPRILRTETAALAAISVAQATWGDWR